MAYVCGNSGLFETVALDEVEIILLSPGDIEPG